MPCEAVLEKSYILGGSPDPSIVTLRCVNPSAAARVFEHRLPLYIRMT